MQKRKSLGFILAFILLFSSILPAGNGLVKAQDIDASSKEVQSEEELETDGLKEKSHQNKEEKTLKNKGKENAPQVDKDAGLNESLEENASDPSKDPFLLDDTDEPDDLSNDSSKETYEKDLPAVNEGEELELNELDLNGSETKIYLNGQSGDDNNSGLSSKRALKTFNKAKEKATNNQNIKEIIVTGETPLEGDISLQGTNAKIIRGKNYNNYLFTITSGKKVTLSNIVIEGNKENKKIKNALINVSGAELYIKDGTVLRNNKVNYRKNQAMGGAIHAGNQSKLYMQGGLIEKNTSVYGGGIYLTHSNLDFSAGIIRNNQAKRHGPDAWNQIYAAGGGICADNGSYVKISAGAKILNNRSDELGGGVSVGSNQGSDAANRFLMQGGRIDGNTAGAAGGGIYMQAQLDEDVINKGKITAGYITNNKMTGKGQLNKAFGGGGIYVNGMPEAIKLGGHWYHGSNAQLELYNTIITDNQAKMQGAGYAACPISVTRIYITDGVAIYNNTGKTEEEKDIYILSSDNFGLHSGNAKYILSKRMLGGVPYEWKKSNGDPLPVSKYKGTLPDDTAFAPYTDNTGNKLTKKLATVVISGNSSTTRGGGIGSNGTVKFGKNEETTDIKVKKIWRPADATLPDKIYVSLIEILDGKEYVVETREITAEDNWETVFKNLPKIVGDKEAVYSVKEKDLYGFVAEVNKKSDTEFEIVNEESDNLIDIPVTKVWEDHENKDGLRPKSITIKLFADGKDTGKSVELNEENDWKATFTNLAESKDAKKIDYSLQEVEVRGYKTSISGDSEEGFTVTNTSKPKKKKLTINGSKTWIDNDNQAGKRPKSITIRLLADGKEIDSKKVTKDDDWKWSFTGLDKYKNGEKIHYTITEDLVEDYTSEVKDFDVKNSYTPGKTQVGVTKIWRDQGDQDDRRPRSITVKLLANGKETGQELILSEANHWAGSFTDLDEYRDGKKIAYTVKELGVRGYTSTIRGDSKKGYTIINSHKPRKTRITGYKTVSGTKTWKDYNNKGGDRPKEITIRLYADGVEIDKKRVTESDAWSWSFDNLDEYKDGKKIKYSISEDKVDGYLTKVDGYNVTNILKPSKNVPVKEIPIKGNPKTGAGASFNFIPFIAPLSLLFLIGKKSSKK